MEVTDDDLAALLRDLGMTPQALLAATSRAWATSAETLRDMARDLCADDVAGLAREIGAVVREH